MSQIRLQAAVRTTVVNATTNTLLAIFKIVIGVIGQSQALMADGIHSFSDLITDFLVLIAAKMGDQKPDKEHPYGHRRIETIGGIIISLVLIGVAVGVAYEAIQKILHHATYGLPTWPTLVVAIVSVIANEGLYRYTLHEANKVNSDLIRTNAWHNRSDVYVSFIVLFAVGGAMLGVPHLDAIGAFVVALLIFRMGLRLIWRGVQELIDASVDPKEVDSIKQHILSVPGVMAVHQLRTRSHGGNVFVDVHIQVAPDISVSEGHYIGETVHVNLLKQINNITDVTVHIDPEDDETTIPSKNCPPRPEIETFIHQALHTSPYFNDIKKISLHYMDGELTIEIVLPLSVLQHADRQLISNTTNDALKLLPTFKQAIIYYV